MIPAADTRLHVVDAPGGTPALLFVNGAFGTLQNWDRVIQRLAGKYRTVRFDARARGKSGKSADYSVQAAVDDIGRVIGATRIQHAIVVGWSHGGTTAVRYAARHPHDVAGLVPIDGAYPIAMFDEAGKEKVRTQFRRLGGIMRILAALGRSARMSAVETAGVVIEMDSVNGELGADFAALECPTVFVVGTGAHSGATEDEMRRMRAAAAEAEASNNAFPYSQRRPTGTRRSSTKRPTRWSPQSRLSSISHPDQRSTTRRGVDGDERGRIVSGSGERRRAITYRGLRVSLRPGVRGACRP